MSTSNVLDAEHQRTREARLARDFVAKILAASPVRRPTSEDERRAHELTAEAYRALGIDAELEPFRWNENLYATLALHFGVATLGTLLSKRRPLLGFALHAAAAGSYALDSYRKAFILRRLFPFKESQNCVATLPAKGPMKLRVVLVSHVDAAFTGLVFNEAVVKRAARSGPLHKAVRLSTMATAGLAVIDLLTASGKRGLALDLARVLLAIPPLGAFLLNADVTLRDRIVPGASDNLSGVAGGLMLAARFLANRPDGVELVFVSSGCEEAGLGGSQAMATDRKGKWDRENTVVIAIDGLSGGKLHTFREGEIFPVHIAPWIQRCVDEVRVEPRFSDVTPFEIPVGGTDFIAFARAGFDGISVGRVDPVLNTPRNYHLPGDTLEAMSAEEIVESVDFVEALIWEIAEAHKLKSA